MKNETVTLKSLRKLGLIPRNTKRWTKQALTVKADYINKFEGRKQIPKGLTFHKVNDRVVKMLRSVHIDVVGNHMVFPTRGGLDKVSIRNTKYGAIIKVTNPQGTTYEIILAENGNHIGYGKKLGANRPTTSWGTLKESGYMLANGTFKMGYLRDMSALRTDFDKALFDDRYQNDPGRDPFQAQQFVTAMIRFNMNG